MRISITTLTRLTDILRGLAPGEADWFPLIEAASHCWLVPALHRALERSGHLAGLPADVRDYLALLHGRNRQRNSLLRGQLVEAVAALNRSGIRPILLKGAGGLFTVAAADLGARMMSDLDLLVDQVDFPAAKAALVELGYSFDPLQRCFWRPQDAGVLELRGAGSSSSPSVFATARFSLVDCGPAEARLPSPTFRALHLILHDQIKDGDYWRGVIDLRHLHDLANLAATAEGVDWEHLGAILTVRLHRNAFETQLLTLRALFGTAVPPALCRRLIPRAQHGRRMIQVRHPQLAAPLRLAGGAAWLARRIRIGDIPPFTLRDIAPRIIRKLLQGRRKTAEALMGIHLGAKV